MGKIQTQLFAEKKLAQLNESIRKGIKSISDEGFDKNRIDKILANELAYQASILKRNPLSELPIGSRAMVEVCKILIQKL